MLQLEGDNYMICGESTAFANRQKSIFDQLDAVAVKQDAISVDNVVKGKGRKFMKTVSGSTCTDRGGDDDDDNSISHKEENHKTKHFKGKESIFKTPELRRPPRFKQTTPDFRRNPHKWVKYSLSDVSQDDMSDKSNTAAAMSFLREIQERKQKSVEPMDVEDKIIFKKPIQHKKGSYSSNIIKISNDESPGEDGTSYFRGSKLVMPEYTIGEKKKKVNKLSAKNESCDSDKTKSAKEITLNHLTDFDDCDEIE